jgi:hypothetical protein
VTDSLQTLMKRAPRPVKLRVKKHDGDTETIDVKGAGGGKRTQWAKLEQTIELIDGATSVDCLGADGTILRSLPLTSDDDADDDEDREERRERASDKAVAKDRRELAAILDAQGRAIERAYAAGSEAASRSNEALTNMVTTLTDNLAIAITNIHNLSANYANALQAQGRPEGDEGNSTVAQLAGLLAPLLMGSMQAPSAPKTNGAAATSPNGKK